VDNYAHVGGLVAGAILALLVPYKRPGEKSTAFIWRGLEIACLIIIATALVLAFRNFSNASASAGGFSNRGTASGSDVDLYFASMNGAARFFEQSARLSQRAMRDGTDEPLARARDLIRSAGERTTGARVALGDEAETFRQQMNVFVVRQQVFVEMIPTRAGAERTALLQEHTAFVAEFESFYNSFKQWAAEYATR
jgi:hypothetical protein